jgi:hypothetical protein
MKKMFEGHLFNRIEVFGNKKYNHVGCESDNSRFMDFLSQFVPEVGMRRKVTFIVESEEEPIFVEEYKSGYVAKEGEY